MGFFCGLEVLEKQVPKGFKKRVVSFCTWSVYFSTNLYEFFSLCSLNEHFYQAWFQLAQWFQTRFKMDNPSFDTFGPLVFRVLPINKKTH
jgi:hypothetical protein